MPSPADLTPTTGTSARRPAPEIGPPSSPVPSALSGEPLPLPRLSGLLVALVRERAEIEFRPNQTDLNEGSDPWFSQVFPLIRAAASRLSTLERTELALTLRREYDLTRLKPFGISLAHGAQTLGALQSRTFDTEEWQASSSRLESLVALHRSQNTDLYLRYPDLSRSVNEFRERHEQLGAELPQRAEKDAITISLALRRFFPQFSTAFDVLAHQTKDTLPHLESTFVQRYGRPLSAEFAAVCNRPGFGLLYPVHSLRARAERLLDHDHHGAQADALIAALLQRGPGRFNRTLAALRSVSSETREGVVLRYNQAASREGLPRFDAIHTLFRKYERDVVLGLSSGDAPRAAALRIARQLTRGVSGAPHLCDYLEEYSPEQLVGLCRSYQVYSGQELAQSLASNQNLPMAVKQRAVALLVCQGLGERSPGLWPTEAADVPVEVLHAAAGVRMAVKKVGHDRVGDWFVGLSADERIELTKSYEAIYGTTLNADLRKHLRRRERLLAEHIIAHGELRDEEAIYQCVDGLGTDVHGIRAVLKHKRTSEIALLDGKFRALMKERHGIAQPLATRLIRETSGDDRHDVQSLLRGWPDSPEGWVERVRSTYRHERSGWFRRIDLITREGPVMDADVARLSEASRSHEESPSAFSARRVELLARMCMRDMAAFRLAKNSLASTIANLSGGIASAASLFTSAQFGIHVQTDLATVGLIVFASSALTRYLVKRSLKGHGYSSEELLQDIAFGTVDGIAPVLARFSPVGFLKRGLDMGTKIGGKTAVGRISKSFFQSRLALRRSNIGGLDEILGQSDQKYHGASGHSDARLECKAQGASDVSVGIHDRALERALRRLLSDIDTTPEKPSLS